MKTNWAQGHGWKKYYSKDQIDQKPCNKEQFCPFFLRPLISFFSYTNNCTDLVQ